MRGGLSRQRGLSGSQIPVQGETAIAVELGRQIRRSAAALRRSSPSRHVARSGSTGSRSFGGEGPHVAEVRQLVVAAERVEGGDGEDLFEGIENQEDGR